MRPLTRIVNIAATALIVVGVTAPAVGASPVDTVAPAPAPGDELRIVAVDTAAFPNVQATVALPLRARGTEVGTEVTVTSGGATVPVVTESLAADGQTVAIMVDTSADADPETFAAVQSGAAEFVRQLDPDTPVVVGTSTSGVVFGPAADMAGAMTAIGILSVGGQRDWPTAIAGTLNVLGGPTRASLVVVSTGASVPSTTANPTLVEGLVRPSLSVRWIGVTPDAGPSGDLQGIQSVTSAAPGELLVRLDSIAADLVAQYRLSFTVDPRATSAAFTLVVDDVTWVVETPLPLPGPAYVPPATAVQVASEAPVVVASQGPVPVANGAQPQTGVQPQTAVMVNDGQSTFGRFRGFVDANWKLVAGLVMALLVLGVMVSAVNVRSRPVSR